MRRWWGFMGWDEEEKSGKNASKRSCRSAGDNLFKNLIEIKSYI